MSPFIVPILLIIVISAYFMLSKWKHKKAVRNKQEDYHIELSDDIQKEYFDEYEREEKGL
ncbi:MULTISPECIES: hypothetical protein [Terrabacteria group]|uniref:hypothetical protein n=1 Tax=Bacillati TaxID=1783272 RepID=UPI00193A9D77|nr:MULTISPECIES: hypothetical protein [Terrabacteria group]MBW9213206.1 hypothetical protein [Trueperella sp. zg.1013]QRG86635.1 hypothetical protein JOS54_07280 [Bulleidia sp. zg-1006]